MGRTAGQQRTLLRELRELAVRTGLALGALGAVWFGLDHPWQPTACMRARPVAAAETLQRCVHATLSAVLWHWTIIIGAGLTLGAIGGVALALAIPTPRGARPRPAREVRRTGDLDGGRRSESV
jgi:hypothetical protein